jgi:hypothetical protein
VSTRSTTPLQAARRLPRRSHRDSTPERLDLSLRSGYEERRVRWDGQRLRFDRTGPRARDSLTFRPSLREWERFWQAVARVGVWQWADGFERGGGGGEQTWSLELSLDSRRLVTSGFDAYPPLAEGPEPTPAFASFCAAVSRLVGGELTN